MNRYDDPNNTTNWNFVLNICNNCFTWLFLLEAIIKIISQGFCLGQYSYLRDSLNILDFVIVVSGISEFFLGYKDLENNQADIFKFLRILRIIRPLRSIRALPTMRKLVRALLNSFPQLVNVLIFLFFIILLFAIFGLQEFNTTIYSRCRQTQKPINSTFWPKSEKYNFVCSKTGYQRQLCPQNLFCGNPIDYGMDLEVDKFDEEVFILYNVPSFQNIFSSIYTVFQIITMDSWTLIMYNLIDGSGKLDFMPVIFCVTLILFGSYFLLNLVLAVIMQAFVKLQEQEYYILFEENKRIEQLFEFHKSNFANNEKKNQPRHSIFGTLTLKTQQQGLVTKQLISNDKGKSILEELRDPQTSLLRKIELTSKFNIFSQKEFVIIMQKMIFFFPPSSEDCDDSDHSQSHLSNLDDQEINNQKYFQQKLKKNRQLLVQLGVIQEVKKNTQQQIDQKLNKKEKNSKIYGAFNLKRKVAVNKEIIETLQQINSSKKDQFLRKTIEHQMFKYFIDLTILVNTVLLALDKYPSEKEAEQIIERINIAFFGIFLVEMFIKMYVYGLRQYANSNFNLFDAFIVIVSLIDIVVSMVIDIQSEKEIQQENSAVIPAMRAFRLLRIFKLAKSWKQFQTLLNTIGNTIKDIGNFSVLLFLFLFIYSLLGQELYAYQVIIDQDGLPQPYTGDFKNINDLEQPAQSFNTLLDAFMSVFIVIVGDGWSNLYTMYTRACGSIRSTFYFLTLLIFGKYIILNLFIAILILNFEEESLFEQKDINEDVLMILEKPQLTIFEKFFISFRKFDQTLTNCCLERRRKKNQSMHSINPNFLNYQKENSSQSQVIQSNSENEQSQKAKKEDAKAIGKNTKAPRHQCAKDDTVENIGIEKEYLSLLYFSHDNKFRMRVQVLIKHARFEQFMIFLIFLSSILLTLEGPLDDPNGLKMIILENINTLISVIFLIEVILKSIAQGFLFNGKNSYLRDGWNIIDFIIAVTSLAAAFLKVIRLIKVLRPLRMVSRYRGLQISIKALIRSIPNILNVMLVANIFLIIFGIICINQFKGKYYDCRITFIGGIGADSYFKEKTIYLDNKFDCINYGGQWIRADNTFDNIFEACLTLFQMTMVGWVVQAQQGMQTRLISQTKDASVSTNFKGLLFIFHIIVCSFFILNLFMGVVISSYNREKDELSNSAMLTNAQKKWLETKRKIIDTKLKFYMKKPQQIWRRKLYDIVQHQRFDQFVMSCIILNTLIMCLLWYNNPKELNEITKGLEAFFTVIFTLELILKLISYGKMFWQCGWNQLDVIIVFGTLLGNFFEIYNGIDVGQAVFVIRAFKVGRLLKLFRYFEGLNLIFITMTMTFPIMTNVGSLLFLFFYIYSIMGMFLFGNVKINYPMNKNLNFQDIGSSMLTMIRVFTGENWQEVMHAVSRHHHSMYQCIENATYDDYVRNGYEAIGCGNKIYAIVFFISFVIMISLVFINLFVAIILEGFDETITENKHTFNVQAHEKVRSIWSNYDPFASGFIRIKDFPKFMLKLGPPIGWNQAIADDQEKQKELIKELELKTYDQKRKFQFQNVLESLMLNSLVQQEMQKMINQNECGHNHTHGHGHHQHHHHHQHSAKHQEQHNKMQSNLRKQLTMSLKTAEDKKEVLMVQDLQDRIAEQLHKNMCKLFHECDDDHLSDDDQFSAVLDRNLDIESVDTDALHQFLEEEKEKARQEQVLKKANILIGMIKKNDTNELAVTDKILAQNLSNDQNSNPLNPLKQLVSKNKSKNSLGIPDQLQQNNRKQIRPVQKQMSRMDIMNELGGLIHTQSAVARIHEIQIQRIQKGMSSRNLQQFGFGIKELKQDGVRKGLSTRNLKFIEFQSKGINSKITGSPAINLKKGISSKDLKMAGINIGKNSSRDLKLGRINLSKPSSRNLKNTENILNQVGKVSSRDLKLIALNNNMIRKEVSSKDLKLISRNQEKQGSSRDLVINSFQFRKGLSSKNLKLGALNLQKQSSNVRTPIGFQTNLEKQQFFLNQKRDIQSIENKLTRPPICFKNFIGHPTPQGFSNSKKGLGSFFDASNYDNQSNITQNLNKSQKSKISTMSLSQKQRAKSIIKKMHNRLQSTKSLYGLQSIEKLNKQVMGINQQRILISKEIEPRKSDLCSQNILNMENQSCSSPIGLRINKEQYSSVSSQTPFNSHINNSSFNIKLQKTDIQMPVPEQEIKLQSDQRSSAKDQFHKFTIQKKLESQKTQKIFNMMRQMSLKNSKKNIRAEMKGMTFNESPVSALSGPKSFRNIEFQMQRKTSFKANTINQKHNRQISSPNLIKNLFESNRLLFNRKRNMSPDLKQNRQDPVKDQSKSLSLSLEEKSVSSIDSRSYNFSRKNKMTHDNQNEINKIDKIDEKSECSSRSGKSFCSFESDSVNSNNSNQDSPSSDSSSSSETIIYEDNNQNPQFK